MAKNKLIIAAAGSGKTTLLVNEALKQKGNVLITTFTEANEEEIKRKIIEINKFIPPNITIQTWFSFLLQHGAKPYQSGIFDEKINGLVLVNCQSAPYVSEEKTKEHYFTDDNRIFSDKLSKFVIKCDSLSGGEIINRLTKIYPNIFIDEIQDLAGYDLEFLNLLFKSPSTILLVGDPRQVTYLTHHENKYKKYRGGLIKDFILNECEKDICEVDEDSLNHSHRNNEEICKFSSLLYPNFKACESKQTIKTDHEGIFLIKENDVSEYCEKYNPQILRSQKSEYPDLNYGFSKGLGFDRVLINPTQPIKKYLVDGCLSKKVKKGSEEIKASFDIAKFYVAVTRAKFSVGIVCDYVDKQEYIQGIRKYNGKEFKTLSDF